MKDLINRILRITLGVAIIGYLIFLELNWINITWSSDDIVHYISMFIAWAIWVYLLASGIKIFYFNKPRVKQVFFGLFLIIFWQYGIVDNPDKLVYLGDLLTVLGVIIVITGAIWVFVFESYIKKKEEEKIEIIEA